MLKARQRHGEDGGLSRLVMCVNRPALAQYLTQNDDDKCRSPALFIVGHQCYVISAMHVCRHLMHDLVHGTWAVHSGAIQGAELPWWQSLAPLALCFEIPVLENLISRLPLKEPHSEHGGSDTDFLQSIPCSNVWASST